VHLDDQLRPRPRERAADLRRRSDVRIGRDDRIRAKRAKLVGDRKRQAGIELRRTGRKEPKPVVAGPRARVQDAQVEDLAERIPLRSEPRLEGKRDPTAADEQNAWRQRAASARIVSSFV
jgi:hypothetical protein